MPEDKRIIFIRNMEMLKNPKVKSYRTEYEVISDTHTVGSFTYEPYYFTIWEFSIKREGEQRKLCLRIRTKELTEEEIPSQATSESAYYHGGGIPEEIIALSSLFLRRKFKLGPVVRINDDPKYIAIKDKGIDTQLITGKSNLAELETWFKLAEGFNPEFHLKFILAAKSYHLAIQMIEEQPDIAYLNLVSAIEILCQETEFKKPTLQEYDQNLYNLIYNNIADEEIRNKISESILNKPPYIKRKFVNFIINHVENSFWKYKNRPDKPVLGRINPDDLPELLEKIYDQRSRTLHNGEPFPIYIFIHPIMGGEIPVGSSIMFAGRKWMKEDYIPYPYFFERLVRHVLINFLKRNQIKRNNNKTVKQKSAKKKNNEQ